MGEQEMKSEFEVWYEDWRKEAPMIMSQDILASRAWQAATLAAEARIRDLEGEWVMVPVKVTRKIEDAIARSRNLKCSEIWENAIDAALTEHKEQS